MSKKIGRMKPLLLLRPYPSASSLLSQNWQKVASIKTWPSTDTGLKPQTVHPWDRSMGRVVLASAVTTASVSLLEMRNLRPHSRPAESDLHVTEPGDSSVFQSEHRTGLPIPPRFHPTFSIKPLISTIWNSAEFCFLPDPLPGQGTQWVELRLGSRTYLLLREAIDDLGHLVLAAGGRHGEPAAPLTHPAGDRRHTLRTGPSQPVQRHSPEPTTSPEAACGQRGGARPPTPTRMAPS